MKSQRKHVHCRGSSKCKGPEVGMSLGCLRSKKAAGMVQRCDCRKWDRMRVNGCVCVCWGACGGQGPVPQGRVSHRKKSDFTVSIRRAMRVLNRDVKRYLLWMILQKLSQATLKNGQRGSEAGDRRGGFCSGPDGRTRDDRNGWIRDVFWTETWQSLVMH